MKPKKTKEEQELADMRAYILSQPIENIKAAAQKLGYELVVSKNDSVADVGNNKSKKSKKEQGIDSLGQVLLNLHKAIDEEDNKLSKEEAASLRKICRESCNLEEDPDWKSYCTKHSVWLEEDK